MGDPHRSTYTFLLLLSIIVICVLSVILRANVVLRCYTLAALLRKTLSALIYEKLLRLPVSGVATASPGKLIAIASGDMALIEQGAWQPCLISAPVSCFFLVFILFYIVRIQVK